MGFERITLGRTGLSVTRLGLAASYGTDEAMVEEAVARGVNYLWWGAIRTRRMARGIRAVASAVKQDRAEELGEHYGEERDWGIADLEKGHISADVLWLGEYLEHPAIGRAL